jgi:hypothetical protein
MIKFRNRRVISRPLDGRNTIRDVIKRVNELYEDVAEFGEAGEEGLKQFNFYENNNTVDANYTVPVGRNAMSAGPLTISDGIKIIVSEGSSLTIV